VDGNINCLWNTVINFCLLNDGKWIKSQPNGPKHWPAVCTLIYQYLNAFSLHKVQPQYAVCPPPAPHQVYHSQYSTYTTGWTIWGFNPKKATRLDFSSPNRPHWLQSPPSLLFNG
jgi:hypothetical protein